MVRADRRLGRSAGAATCHRGDRQHDWRAAQPCRAGLV